MITITLIPSNQVLYYQNADDQQPLSDDELRILKIVLADHLDKLNENKLSLDLAISGELTITKKMVVDGLHIIGQIHISKILDKKQGTQ